LGSIITHHPNGKFFLAGPILIQFSNSFADKSDDHLGHAEENSPLATQFISTIAEMAMNFNETTATRYI